MNQNKPLNEYTIEELEKIELQLWRTRHEAQVTLERSANELNIIAEIIKKKQEDN
jgi:hypothetical protein